MSAGTQNLAETPVESVSTSAGPVVYRFLPKDQWHLLVDFFAQHCDGQAPPAPEVSEAVVAVTPEGEIVGAFFSTMLIRFGPFAVHKDFRGTGEISYSAMFESMRAVADAYGLTGTPFVAFAPDDKRQEKMEALGLTLTDWRVYLGEV